MPPSGVSPPVISHLQSQTRYPARVCAHRCRAAGLSGSARSAASTGRPGAECPARGRGTGVTSP
ncbi:hypothetical protein ACFPRL_11475 [Pseudoclavibacter helvolus]